MTTLSQRDVDFYVFNHVLFICSEQVGETRLSIMSKFGVFLNILKQPKRVYLI